MTLPSWIRTNVRAPHARCKTGGQEPPSGLTEQTHTGRGCLEQRGWSHSQGELTNLRKHQNTEDIETIILLAVFPFCHSLLIKALWAHFLIFRYQERFRISGKYASALVSHYWVQAADRLKGSEMNWRWSYARMDERRPQVNRPWQHYPPKPSHTFTVLSHSSYRS